LEELDKDILGRNVSVLSRKQSRAGSSYSRKSSSM